MQKNSENIHARTPQSTGQAASYGLCVLFKGTLAVIVEGAESAVLSLNSVTCFLLFQGIQPATFQYRGRLFNL